jgi:hypothetical protein
MCPIMVPGSSRRADWGLGETRLRPDPVPGPGQETRGARFKEGGDGCSPSKAGDDGESGSGEAEVLAALWARSRELAPIMVPQFGPNHARDRPEVPEITPYHPRFIPDSSQLHLLFIPIDG